MRLYNPSIELGGDYLKVRKGEGTMEWRPGSMLEVSESDAAKLVNIYPFLKNPDNPLYSADYHVNQLKKPSWFKRLWRRG